MASPRYAIILLERRLGLEGHSRAVVEHRKAGRDHLHVVWSRIDTATMKAVHDGLNYRAHEEVARQLEREFAHRPVQGAHVGRDDRPRPARTPATAELQQAARTGTDPAAITAEITRLWQAADSGQAFAAALQAAGYGLAQGDKRGFCLIDPAGGVHSLARRIAGVRTKEVNARLAEIELASLPTVDQARDQRRQRQAAPAVPSKDPTPPSASRGGVPGGAGIPVINTPATPPQRAATGAATLPAGGKVVAALKPPAIPVSENRPAAQADHRRPDQAAGQLQVGRGRGSETLYSVGIRLGPAAPISRAAVPAEGGGGIARSRPAGALLARLGSVFGSGRSIGGLAVQAVVPRLLTLFLERLNIRRPDGPSTESIAKIQEQIDKLTAYGLSTGESTAEQVQELKNVLHALREQAGARAVLGPYYRPEHRNRQPGC